MRYEADRGDTRSVERPAGRTAKSGYRRLLDGSKTPQGRFNVWFWLVAIGVFLLVQALVTGLRTEQLSYNLSPQIVPQRVPVPCGLRTKSDD